MLMRLDTSVFLARVDPRSLEPVSRRVDVDEYHHAWSLSPDRSQLAVGVSAPGKRGRVGILVVDLAAMKVVRRIETGIAAVALAWPRPHLLIAGLLRGGMVLVDPRTGTILRRWPPSSAWPPLSDPPQASARTRDGGLALLFPGRRSNARTQTAAPRLAVVDRMGQLRSVALERIRLTFRDGVQWDAAALAVDPARARAYVLPPDAPVAEIDLQKLRVSYHRLEALFLPPGELSDAEPEPNDEVSWRHRRALWLREGRILVFGHDHVRPVGVDRFEAIPAGALLVDTATWSSCVLDATAAAATFLGRTVLAYGRGDRASGGLRAYTSDGRNTYRALDGKPVSGVQAAGGLAYVRGRAVEFSPLGGSRSVVHLIDVRSGTVVGNVAPESELVDVVVGRP
jgi:hypothetical protein